MPRLQRPGNWGFQRFSSGRATSGLFSGKESFALDHRPRQPHHYAGEWAEIKINIGNSARGTIALNFQGSPLGKKQLSIGLSMINSQNSSAGTPRLTARET